MAVKHLSDGNPDGTVLGQSSTDKVGLHGATPVAQRSGADQAAIGAALTHSVGTADGTVDDVGAAFNQTTLNNNFKELSTRCNDLRTLVNELRTALVNLGAIKGAA
jgi:predicted HD phosphohydrolase